MPQQAWSSLEERGAPKRKAKETRTVNKERARKGEAQTSSRLSRSDLSSEQRGGGRREAKRMGIEGHSRTTERQLKRAAEARKERRITPSRVGTVEA
jgi:hypothetical protein